MSMTTASRRGLEIGAVFEDTFRVLQRRWVDFLLLSLLLIVLPNFLGLFIRFMGAAGGFIGVAITLITSILGFVLQGALFYGTTRDLNGKRADLEDMLRIGFKACLPMVGLTLLVFIPVEIGMLFLLAPGVYLFLRWCVAGPAMIAEDLGLFGAMKRSAELTKGRRWSILLTTIVIMVAMGIVYAGFVALAGGATGVLALTSAQVATPYTLLMLALVSPVLAVVLAVGVGVSFSALFHELRGAAGSTVEAMAEVFA